MVSKVIGIDLGTTNSVAAFLENGQPRIIADKDGEVSTPSIVAYNESKETYVGQIAKRQAVLNPKCTYASVKRFIGRSVNELGDTAKYVSYDLDLTKGKILLECPNMGRSFTPEEISAQVIRKIVEDAKEYTLCSVTQAVITVPAYFNDSQRQATKDAGTIAGIEVLRVLNEPTAAALEYGFRETDEETILVFDLGGGTFDVSILEVADGVFEVLSTCGDTALGGNDFDNCLIEWMLEKFKAETNIDLRGDSSAVQRITQAAETAKIELTGLEESTISIPFIHHRKEDKTNYHIKELLTREDFNSKVKHLTEKCLDPVKTALTDAKQDRTDITETILVGGSTRMPCVKDTVRNFMDREPNNSMNPDQIVALGAAIQAGVLAGEVDDIVLIDVTPLSLGVATFGGKTQIIIPRGTIIPVKKSELFTTSHPESREVKIEVVQGERAWSKANKSLGSFQLEDLQPQTSDGQRARIAVTFEIDANGILDVTAKDHVTQREATITISGSSNLPEAEVTRMIAEAAQQTAADITKVEQFSLESNVELQIKLGRDLATKAANGAVIKTHLEALEDAYRSGDVPCMKKNVALLESEIEVHYNSQKSPTSTEDEDPSTVVFDV
jgi:molecular chaperone DnaK